MRKIFILAILCCFTRTIIFSQFTTEEITYGNRVDLDNSNSWSVGGGFSNLIMHGDLRSVGTGDLGTYYNFGAFAYANKMFNPLLGLEVKITYSQISGGAQYFSDAYEILYVPNTVIKDNIYFKGNTYGAELNLVLSLTNLYKTKATKWNTAGYLGGGYHQYDSQLFEKNLANGPDKPLIDFGNNPARNSKNSATSIYLSVQLGLKRRLSKKVDIELRTGMYFNYEDHLDATISNKQNWETFFVTSLGIAVKLGKKKIFSIWGDENYDNNTQLQIIDTDKDGVIDQLDTEPNTPLGALVYGNGKAIDSDKDGISDYKDKCPLKYGSVSNKGCPLSTDSDGDGLIDEKDLCPNQAGLKENKGCPLLKNLNKDGNAIHQQIAFLATNIYFDTNSDKIKNISFENIDKIVKLMNKIPKVLFVIEGHTDNRNSEEYNYYLSRKRASAVKRYMTQRGVTSNRLKIEGYGEARPKYSNWNAGGRQLNRRVEILALDFLK